MLSFKGSEFGVSGSRLWGQGFGGSFSGGAWIRGMVRSSASRPSYSKSRLGFRV